MPAKFLRRLTGTSSKWTPDFWRKHSNEHTKQVKQKLRRQYWYHLFLHPCFFVSTLNPNLIQRKLYKHTVSSALYVFISKSPYKKIQWRLIWYTCTPMSILHSNIFLNFFIIWKRLTAIEEASHSWKSFSTITVI